MGGRLICILTLYVRKIRMGHRGPARVMEDTGKGNRGPGSGKQTIGKGNGGHQDVSQRWRCGEDVGRCGRMWGDVRDFL